MFSRGRHATGDGAGQQCDEQAIVMDQALVDLAAPLARHHQTAVLFDRVRADVASPTDRSIYCRSLVRRGAFDDGFALFGAGLIDDLLETAGMPARADRRATVDPGRADRLEAFGVGGPRLTRLA